MRSETVFGRLFSGAAVLTAVETDGDEVGRLLDERYGVTPPELSGADEQRGTCLLFERQI